MKFIGYTIQSGDLFVCPDCGKVATALQLDFARFNFDCPTPECGRRLSDYTLKIFPRFSDDEN